MEDLVKPALEQNKNLPPDQQEGDDKQDGQSGEFGAPVCAVIGCGTDGIECANRVEVADLSVGVSLQQGTDLPIENVDTVISTVDPNVPPLTDRTESPQLQNRSQSSQGNVTDWMPNRVKLGTEFQNAIGEADVLAVPLNLCEESIGQLAANVCLEAGADRTVIALPTIPPDELTNGTRAAFRALVDAADTTVPFDTARITDAFSHSKSRLPGAHREVESVLTAEWISDVFAAFRSPIAGDPAQRLPLFRTLNSGGVSMLYWGWGTRQEEWDELISHAASHRVSDGKRRTADGGFGFVRFGGMFTRKDFDDLRTATADRLRHDEMKDDRWTVCGDTGRGLGSECRLAVLLTGLEVDTLPYI